MNEIVFWHPSCYRPNGVAGSGAYALVCRAEIADPDFAQRLHDSGLLPFVAADEVGDEMPDGAQDEDNPRDAPSATRVEPIAIKRLRDAWTSTRSKDPAFALHYLRKICRELTILRHLRYVPQVIKLIDVYTAPNSQELYLVMPYVQYTLKQVIEKFHPLEEGLIKWIVFQVLLALRALHRNGMIHRDLTLTNILVGADRNTWPAWVCDFGLSRARETSDEKLTTDVVTMPYRAPEIVMELATYTSAIDIWSMGCIMAECFLGRPFMYLGDQVNPDNLKQLKLMMRSLTGLPTLDKVHLVACPATARLIEQWHKALIDSGKSIPAATDVAVHMRRVWPNVPISDEALDVLRRMVALVPGERATAEELLQMPWFANDPNIPLQQELEDAVAADPHLQWDNTVETMDFEQLEALLATFTQGRVADVQSRITAQDGGAIQGADGVAE